jgi:hypothetical protein
MNENEEPQPSPPDTQATPDATPLPEKPTVESAQPVPSVTPVSQVVPQASAPPTVATPKPNAAIILQQNQDVEQEMHRMSRRSFLWAAATVATGFVGWQWLISRRDEDGVLWPLRSTLNFNEQLARDYFQEARLAPTFPRAKAQTPRANGDIGLSDDFDPTTWKLQVIGLMESVGPLTLEDIKALPRMEMVTELKCIEGWSTIVQWAGARFADFVRKYPPGPTDEGKLPEYVGMETPDGEYYVGLDMDSAMHPQTLLCYEMNGQPLTLDHGAPLRLVIPVKYGIKSIKCIGTIRFTSERPKDYWATLGYDWYAGH